MRIKTRTHTVHSVVIDDMEVPLEYPPDNEDAILAERVGDKLVVAYLVYDNCPSNPLKDGDCQGDLYTNGGGVITDDASEVYSNLRLSGGRWSDPEPCIDCGFHLVDGGPLVSCRELAASEIYTELIKDPQEMPDFFDALDLPRLGIASRYVHWLKSDEGKEVTLRDLNDCNTFFYERVEERARELFAKHWKRIVGPYVVPMYYHDERGSTSIGFSEWDGDHDDLPNAIWVADKGAIENIDATARPDNVEVKQVEPYPASIYVVLENGVEVFRGTYGEVSLWSKKKYPPTFGTLRATAIRYAEAVCDEYAKWCRGEAFGCVVETFELQNPEEVVEGDDPEWEQVNEDACWGFIGYDYAMENLKSEFFEPAVKRLKELNKEEA